MGRGTIISMKTTYANKLHNTTLKAFTIVELLIVVVVIAILAAITIVAYNGITNQATTASTKANLSTVTKKVALKTVENGDTVPTNLTQAGIANTEQTEYRYTHNTTDNTYCITAIDKVKQESYHTTNTNSSPQEGRCPNHEDAKYMTNLITNPGFERNLDGWVAYGGATIERSTEQARSGAYSLKITPAANGVSGAIGAAVRASGLNKVRVMGSVFIEGAPPVGHGVVQRGYKFESNGGGSTNISVYNSWQNGTSMDIGTFSGEPEDVTLIVRPYVEYTSNGVGTPSIVYIDTMSICTGYFSVSVVCADGDSPSWIWNPDGTSTGPRP